MIDLSNLTEALKDETFVTELANTNIYDINSIYPNPHQPRFDENVEELKASIQNAFEELKEQEPNSKPEDGLLEPIIISPKSTGIGFVCVGGHRRLKACKELGHSTIKANCIKLNESQLLSFSIVENLQRVNLTALETAIAINRALDTKVFKSETHLAKALGKTPAFISKCKSVLKLPKEILEDLHDDKSKIGLEILVDLQRVKDDDKKIELYEQYKKGEIKQVDIRDTIKKDKGLSNKKDDIGNFQEQLLKRIKELEKEIKELNNKEVFIVGYSSREGSTVGGGFRCRALNENEAIEIAKKENYHNLANDKNIIWEARTLKSGCNEGNIFNDHIGYGFGTVNDIGTYIAVIDGDFEATITFRKNGDFIKNTNNKEYQVIIKETTEELK